MTASDAGELQTAFPSCKRGTNLYVRRTATDLGRTVVIFIDKLQLFRLNPFVDRSNIASGDRVDSRVIAPHRRFGSSLTGSELCYYRSLRGELGYWMCIIVTRPAERANSAN